VSSGLLQSKAKHCLRKTGAAGAKHLPHTPNPAIKVKPAKAGTTVIWRWV
jgi:hypothetical protein